VILTKVQQRLEYINLKVDRRVTDILDLDQFLELCFETSLEVRVAKEIIKEITEQGQSYLLTLKRKLVRSKKNPEGICSNGTLSLVWKKMLNSGMISRKYRHDPAKFSPQFSHRLQKPVAEYWIKWLGRR